MNESRETPMGQDANKIDTASSTEEAGQQPQTEKQGEALQNRISELEKQVQEKEAKYLYLYAEFDNFKKRSIKERSDLIKFGWESVARELLQTLDNLDLAIAHTPPNTDPKLIEGLRMVFHQFKSSLQKQGVETIESIQKTFDPNLHEAVGQEKSDLPTGTVTKEFSRGYTLHGRLLRPARVIVSSGE